MGIVIRKSLATTFFSYLGVVIGYLNILYFFPRFLSPAQIGLYRLILDSAILLAPFAQSGIMQGIIKFYPSYRNKNEKKDFELFTLLFLFISLLLFLGALLLFKNQVLSFLFQKNIAEVGEFFNLLLFLILILSLIAFFEGFSRANISIVLVNFLKDVYIRILTALSIFLYYQQWLTYEGLLYALLVIYGSAGIILAVQTITKHKITAFATLSSLSMRGVKEIISYNFFMVISAGSNLVVGKIDSLMVSAFLGLAENGIYTTLFYVAVVVEIPKRAVGQIAISLYSKAFARHDLAEIKSLYFKTALNQLIVGLLLYLGLVVNLHNLFYFIPNGEEFEVGKWVIVIVGASRVIDMAAGANGELIIMSQHYRFNVVAIGSLALLTILTNYLLIPVYGINGAAIASLLSLLIFNLVKMLYIHKRFGIHPFKKQTVLVLGIGLLAFGAGFFIPAMENHFLDLFIRSGALTLLYGILIYASKASDEINSFLNGLFKK